MGKYSVQIHKNTLSPAIEMIESGKYSEAQEWLNNSIGHEPRNAEALSLLSQAYLLDRKVDDAEQALSAAVLINSKLPSIRRNQARLLLKRARKREALEIAQLACEESDKNIESQLVLAACLVANDRDSESMVLIQQILNDKSSYAEAYANRALIKFRAKDLEGAIEDAKLTLSLKPHLTQIWQLLSTIHYQTGKLGLAIEALKKAYIIEPNNTDIMTQLGRLLQLDNRACEAIPILEEAVKLAPQAENAWTNLGVAFQHEGKIDDAKIAYEKAIKLTPNSATVLSNLGVLANEANESETALMYFEKALENNPNLHEVHNNMGVALKELGKLDRAVESFKEAIELKPNYAEAHSNLGTTLSDLVRLIEAEESFDRAIKLHPDFAEAHNNRGNALKALGRLDDAKASYEKAISLQPNLAEVHCNMGDLLKELGRVDQAQASYYRAIELNDDYAAAHFKLGLTLPGIGRVDEAAASFRRVIDLDPNDLNAQNQLLMCLFLQDAKSQFIDQLDYLNSLNTTSAIIGSYANRFNLKYGLEKPNSFCTAPLDYVLQIDLRALYDFKNIFAERAKRILDESRISNRVQNLLVNGYQTSGNIFDIERDSTKEIQDIIRNEVEKYRLKFKGSKEGVIKYMPDNYNLYGWLISMKSGGNLKPHIHTGGWLSGSIYINVPKKRQEDSGNLVVALGDDNDSILNEKETIDVVTGSMVLFPASLMHHTIPFESEEERVVLAFDLREK